MKFKNRRQNSTQADHLRCFTVHLATLKFSLALVSRLLVVQMWYKVMSRCSFQKHTMLWSCKATEGFAFAVMRGICFVSDRDCISSTQNVAPRRSHPAAAKGSTSVVETDSASADSTSSAPDATRAALYVHWPYCRRRCTYCNFNKYISRSVNEERMRRCLEMETKTLLDLSAVTSITSVFFGGGTPSLASPGTIASVLDLVRNSVSLSDEAEVTLEVNPTAMETEKLRDFRLAGVNRISIGVQSLDPMALFVLGRDHSVSDALRCMEVSRQLFGERVSADLIFGWPGQTTRGWRQELHKMLGLCGSHLSLYQLTLERGTALFKRVQQGETKLPETDVMATMYVEAVKVLQSHGFEQYEVSNFAKKGHYSTHNLSYWRGAQYIGVGPGAHGRFSVGGGRRQARTQTLEPDNWMWEVEKYGHATRRALPLSCKDRMEELLYLGLRTKWGISNEMWEQVNPRMSLQDIFGSSPDMQSLVQRQLLQLDARGLRATGAGLTVLDSITVDLLGLLQAAEPADSG